MPDNSPVTPASQIKSRRGRILNNLIRQLQTIKVANGYATDVVCVTQDVKTWDQISEAECPTIFVIDSITKYQYHAGPLTERTWDVYLFAVMKNSTQAAMEELIADIEDCTTANITLYFPDSDTVSVSRTVQNGPCDQIRIKDIVTDNQLFSQVDGSQLFKVTLEIKYTANYRSIR